MPLVSVWYILARWLTRLTTKEHLYSRYSIQKRKIIYQIITLLVPDYLSRSMQFNNAQLPPYWAETAAVEIRKTETVVLGCWGCGGWSICLSINCVISCTARSGQTDVAQRITEDESSLNSTVNNTANTHIIEPLYSYALSVSIFYQHFII